MIVSYTCIVLAMQLIQKLSNMKSLNNLHGNPLFVGSLVYCADKAYQSNIADVISIGRTNVTVSYTHFNTRKLTIRKVNVTKFHLPLIHNANVSGIEYDPKQLKYVQIAD